VVWREQAFHDAAAASTTMRLLDARRPELVDVRDDAVPPYAILSHTWADDEITPRELLRMKGKIPHTLDKHKRAIVEK
jgi:hypothetical protein